MPIGQSFGNYFIQHHLHVVSEKAIVQTNISCLRFSIYKLYNNELPSNDKGFVIRVSTVDRNGISC